MIAHATISPALLPWLPLVGLLALAAATDLRARRIPNLLSFSLLFAGIAQSFMAARTLGPGASALGFLVGFGLTFPLFAIGALGGGDVKLLAAVGTWAGPWPTLLIFAAAGIIGLVIVLAQAAWQGQMRILFRNSALLAINLVHLQDVGVEHVRATGQSCASVQRPLPYAVPVLLGTVLVLAYTLKGR